MRLAEEEQEAAAARSEQLAAQRSRLHRLAVPTVDRGIRDCTFKSTLEHPCLVQQSAEDIQILAHRQNLAHFTRDTAQLAKVRTVGRRARGLTRQYCFGVPRRS